MMKTRFLAALLFTCAGVHAAGPEFSEKRMAHHIEVLASDEFEGRGVATAGEKKTVDYIVGQFKAAGLKPGGDPQPGGNRAWTQDVTLARFAITSPIALEATTPQGSASWTNGEELVVRPALTGAARVAIDKAPVVFIGYGVTAPEQRWDDFKGFDLRGKIALVLVNDPDYESGAGDFGGKAMTWYGRWPYKYEEAARRGALGILVIHERGPAGYGWATVKNSWQDVFDITRADPAQAHCLLEGWIQGDAAKSLLKSGGHDLEALRRLAQTRDFRPVELAGVTLSANFDVKADRVVTHNVVGVLPGSRRPAEHLLFTAHWDHLGVGRADAKGDRIYHGAVDNASGVSLLIELARTFARERRTDRSVVFMATTAEEQGLLGAQYYAAQPLYPAGTTVAVLNMDGMNVFGRSRDFSAAGDSPLTLQDDLIRVVKAHGFAFAPEAHPENGSYFRNDHFPFAKAGIPAITFSGGSDLEKGGKAAAEAAYAAYIKDKYHQPADKFDPAWDLSGMVQEAVVFHALGRELANGRSWPEWKPGAEFKAERDRTAAQRQRN